MRRLLILTTLLACSVTVAASDDAPRFLVVEGDTLWFTEPVVIVGSRVPAALPGLLRPMSLVGARDLEERPARSVAEALSAVADLDVRQRQLMGAQADLSIRGSTFEQVQVLLDGVDVGDPQTGHHNLNLPVGMGEVARLEVLPGHGSTLYGANAFGGVVNVVSRVPSERVGGEVSLTGGEFGTLGGRLALESGEYGLAGRWRTRVAVERFATDGDVPGTDLESTSATIRSRGRGSLGELDLLTGWSRREFGARDFYAPFDSEERTEALFTMLRLRRSLGERVVVEPTVAFRRHEDHFVLMRDNPDVYVNDHLTRRTTADLRASVDAGYGLKVAAGLEGAWEDIESTGIRGGNPVTALGDHDRRRTSAAAELAGIHRRVRWSAGARVDDWRDLDAHVSRSAALAWDATSNVVLRGSAGTIHRIPTFTELYYEDPVNLGNADLAPETGWAWDAGLDVATGPWTVAWTVFARDESDLIDWIRPVDAPDTPWRAANIGDGETSGWSQSAFLETPAGHRFGVGYTGLVRTTSLPEGWTGKYVSLAPRHRVTAEATLALPRGIRLTHMLRGWRRPDGSSHAVLDVRAACTLAGVRVHADVTNVLDRAYEEVPGVPLPGRMATVTSTWGF